jgi:hypothetical protein
VAPPWLVIAPAGNPVIRIDLRALDSFDLYDDEQAPSDSSGSDAVASFNLLLCCGDVAVGLSIADGPDAAATLVREAQPLLGLERTEDPVVVVGHDVVRQDGDHLVIGPQRFLIGEVREYALRGANLPLTGGRMLQAAMALLVVAANERTSD